ncbi:MAG: 7,8-didemethyl-8-hydroxy-5-deazariboflavin synthase subunit CofH [Promethearchaeota archaeon]
MTTSTISNFDTTYWENVDEITPKDALELFSMEGNAVLDLAKLANKLSESMHGQRVSFVVNRNINFTNSCQFNCKFCAFHVSPDNPDVYLLTPEEVRKKTIEAFNKEPTLTEICIQGGINPKISIELIEKYIKAIKSVNMSIHIHGFSPQEIWNLSRVEHSSVKEILSRLADAGLGSIPGTAAEILVDKVREKICPSKIKTSRWIDIIKTAHRVGLPSTSTIMYGHVESIENIIEHLNILRNIQKETRGITEFVPLPFMNTGDIDPNLKTSSKPENGMLDLKLHAISRIFFKNTIKNIQCSWVKLGVKLAQILLNAGVNDFSGTLMEENITRLAGGTNGEYLSSEKMITLIKNAGKIPVQRTTTYEILQEFQ